MGHSRSGKLIPKATVLNGNMHLRDAASTCHAREKLSRHFRQHGARQDMIDVARAAFHFLATAQNLIDYSVVVAEFGAVIFLQPGRDTAELEFDDLGHHVIAYWIV